MFANSTARVPSGVSLRLLGWEYDEAADMILGVFTDAPAPDDTNPAGFQPSLRYIVALEVIASEIQPLDELTTDSGAV
ncbi:hypothetical protein [Umezawaea sp. Da 62-37]|uniref:hypothetical protein n=1 Tax=Umezawaea sp. Da 62-37 TaxID=3075927 RepID=UPI0028F6E160|nr:hypothetical protein [Umezawaea sp. Da 62-37]WNV90320.1 hypothetical protein RM788_19175 [Umezawaea sp. Da 62-37]